MSVVWAGVESVWLELRHCHCLRNEMAHFCTDLQTYIMFEVLETAWDIFMAQLQVSPPCHCLPCLPEMCHAVHACKRSQPQCASQVQVK